MLGSHGLGSTAFPPHGDVRGELDPRPRGGASRLSVFPYGLSYGDGLEPRQRLVLAPVSRPHEGRRVDRGEDPGVAGRPSRASTPAAKHLATRTRESISGSGPLYDSDLAEAYRSVTGYDPLPNSSLSRRAEHGWGQEATQIVAYWATAIRLLDYEKSWSGNAHGPGRTAD